MSRLPLPKAPTRTPGEFLPGDRVVTGGRHGVVHFMGLVKFATGRYVGIELDAAEGKHDGAMKGDRYFTCPPLHGVFVKPSMVQLETEAPAAATAAAAAAPAAAAAAAPTPSKLRKPTEVADIAHLSASTTPSAPRSPALSPAAAPAASSMDVKSLKSSAAPSPASSATATPARSSPNLTATPAPKASMLPMPPLTSARVASPAPQDHESVSPAPPATVAAPAASPPAAAAPAAAAPAPAQTILAAAASPSHPASAQSVAAAALAAADLQRVQLELDALQASHDQETAELKQTQTMLVEQSAELSQLQSMHEKQSAELKQAQASLASLQAEKQRAVDETARLQTQLSTRERELQEEKLRSLEASTRLSAELSERDRELADLRTQLHAADSGDNQVESLQSMIEMLTLDKALAEETAENAQAELGTLKEVHTNLELEFELLKEQFEAAQSAPSAAASSAPVDAAAAGNSAANAKLLEQSQLLSEALRKMRDLNLGEKQASSARIGELEAQLAALAKTEEQNVSLRSQLSQALADEASLKEQLDEALGLQAMVESLSSAKLDLEEQVKAHARSIAYLESLASASREMEDEASDFQAALQRDLEAREADLNDLAQRYKLKQSQIEDVQATSRKFRELVRQLESENQALKHAVLEAGVSPRSKGAASGSTDSAPQTGLAATRSSSLLTLRLKQVRTAHLDALLTTLEKDASDRRFQFLSLYLPSNVQMDDRSFSFLAMLDRVRGKAQVLARVWGEFFGGAGGQGGVGGDGSGVGGGGSASMLALHKVHVDYSANGTTPELALLAYHACLLLASLIHACENLTGSLTTLDVESYNSLCIRAGGELAPLESILDSYLAMVQMDTLNELTSLQSLVQACQVAFAFNAEKVPLPPPALGAATGVEEFNALPYKMALWTVIQKNGQGTDDATVQRWTELTGTFKQRALKAASRPPVTGAAAALVPSSVPSLPTFALTLTYSASLSQTLAQLVSDQLNSLGEAMRRGRKKLQLEAEDARVRKERADALGGGQTVPIEAPLSSTHASLGDVASAEDEDSDIALFQQHLFSEISDAAMNNLSLASQLQASVRNYTNSIASAGGAGTSQAERDEARLSRERALVKLLPHMHAIDTVAHQTSRQLTQLLHAIQPLLQVEHLNEISNAMTLEPTEGGLTHPLLQQLRQLLEVAKTKSDSGADASLLTSLATMRAELFALSKMVLTLIDDNSSGHGSSGNELDNVAARALLQRQASFVLTVPESALAAPPTGADAATQKEALAAVLSSVQPWFHHPLTVRSQLSATASLRVSLQDLTARLTEKQKEIYAIQRQVTEEKSKQEVLLQQLALHQNRATAQNEYATLAENLRTQLAESQKQLNVTRLDMDKLQLENKTLRKQMVKLRKQYLQEEQTRAQMVAAGVGSAPSAIGGSALGAAPVHNANTAELLQEVDLLRATLRGTRDELAHWKARQTLIALETQLLPPLPSVEPPVGVAARVQPPVASMPMPSAASAVLPPSLGWSPTPFQASKLAGSLSLARNPHVSSKSPAASQAAPRTADGSAVSPVAAPAAATPSSTVHADEVRLLQGQVSELAQAVWKARVAPRIVRIPPPGEKAQKPDAEEGKFAAPTPAPQASPFQQYISQRVQAVQLQQHCHKLHQRVTRLADLQAGQRFQPAPWITAV